MPSAIHSPENTLRFKILFAAIGYRFTSQPGGPASARAATWRAETRQYLARQRQAQVFILAACLLTANLASGWRVCGRRNVFYSLPIAVLAVAAGGTWGRNDTGFVGAEIDRGETVRWGKACSLLHPAFSLHGSIARLPCLYS